MYSHKINEWLNEFNIENDFNNPDKVRGQILSHIAGLHPDKTGGKFASHEQEENYLKLSKLLEEFDREISAATQMIPLIQAVSLFEALIKNQKSPPTRLAAEFDSAKEQYRRHAKRRYALPKFTSAIFASLCLILISLLGNFKNNPLYRFTVDYYALGYQKDLRETFNIRISNYLDEWTNVVARAQFFPSLRGALINIKKMMIKMMISCQNMLLTKS